MYVSPTGSTAPTNVPGVVSTLVGGIQDIAGFLPVLGTGQCEEHIGSALSRGYIYAAASPISVFGSPGVILAGIKTLAASVSIPRWGFFGAEVLDDAGFKPAGDSLSLILMDAKSRKRCLAETRFDELLDKLQVKNLHVHDLPRINVMMKTSEWNFKLFLSTAVLSCLGIVPYIQINSQRNNILSLFNRWAFPLSRMIGTFLVATFIQIVIQRRLLSILRKRVVFHAINNGRHSGILRTIFPDYWNLETSSERSLSQIDRFLGHPVKMPRPSLAPPDPPTSLHHGRYSQTDVEKLSDESSASVKSQLYTSRAPDELPSNQDLLLKAKAERDNAYSAIKFGAFSIWDVVVYIVLLLGLVGSTAGYILSFSVVQHADTSTTVSGPVTWVFLESLLAGIRIALWGWNTDKDDLGPFQLTIDLDSTPPLLSSLANSKEVILETKTLPLTPSLDFLRLVRFFTGRLPDFDLDECPVYYTLTRSDKDSHHALFISVIDRSGSSPRPFVYHYKTRKTVLKDGELLIAEVLPTLLEDSLRDPQFLTILKPIHSGPASVLDFSLDWLERLERLDDHYKGIWRQLVRPVGPAVETIELEWILAISRKHPSPPFTITPRQRREGEEIIQPQPREFARLQQKRHNKINTEHARLDKYINEIRSEVQFRIDKWHAENHTESTALSNLNIIMLANRLFSGECHFIFEVGAWEHRLRNALLDTSKHVSPTLESRFQVQAIQRLQADQARATERVRRERRGLGFGVPTEVFPALYWESLQLIFDKRWNALVTQSHQDPEEAAAHLQILSKPPEVVEALPSASVAAQELVQGDRKETEIKIWSDIPRSINNITRDLPNVDVAPLFTASETKAPGPSTLKWFIIPNVAAAARLIQNESVAFLQFDAADWRDESDMASAIRRVVSKMSSSLTTIAVIVHASGELSPHLESAVKKVASNHRGLESIYVLRLIPGATPLTVFKSPPSDALLYGKSESDTNDSQLQVSFTFEGLYVDASGDFVRNHSTIQSRFSVRFRVSPMEDNGNYVLVLRHRFSRAARTVHNLQIFMNGKLFPTNLLALPNPIATAHAQPGAKEAVRNYNGILPRNVRLPPAIPGMNVVSVVVPHETMYELYDVELCRSDREDVVSPPVDFGVTQVDGDGRGDGGVPKPPVVGRGRTGTGYAQTQREGSMSSSTKTSWRGQSRRTSGAVSSRLAGLS
ncbi:hypothetical protein DXG01_006056 [Tephrocybe rancida]|nr:hypothetical protein DXG01_006056 [Tephrocybe rancida]